ncbi:MAG TPA: C-type lectin domain-containing protein, partial [Polyangiaceae bacterium]
CTCQPASCSDTVKNQNESDVDCGGICGSTCAEGRSCLVNADCSTVNCASLVCGPFLCNGPGDFTYGLHCYHFFASYATWQAALASCQSWGGSLVSINSQAENDYLWNNYVRNVTYTWIGLNDISVEGTFVWANGDPVVYTHWYGGGAPINDAEDCIIMTAWHLDDGTWTDLPCSSGSSAYYMCERGGS